MRLYNTLTRQIEELEPLNPPKVGVYICGPTVYDYTHIGHLRAYINSDVLIRALEFLGFEPETVMNITDVGHLTGDRDMGEDKLEKKAKQEKKDIWQIAQFYTDHFFQSMKAVNVLQPKVICKATDYIQEMIALVKKLEQKGLTYKTSDGIYFDTSKVDDYGKLAQVDLNQLKEGARIEKNPEKKNPTDFALWKLAKKGEQRQMEWSSPWGEQSFPGWHIECSAMSMKHLGEQFDLHVGGIDHINVHHTNEIAQSEAATGKKPFVKYWFHSEWLLVDNKKMSKSLKNFYTLEDIKKQEIKALALRYLFLQSHYRTRANFTWQALKAANQAYAKLLGYMTSLAKSRQSLSAERVDKIDQYSQQFRKLISDDLNMPEALALVWQVVKSNIPNQDKRDLVLDWDQVLGLNLAQGLQKQAEDVPTAVQELVKQREELRKNKKWAEADKLRKQIEEQGYQVEDTTEGTAVHKKIQ